MGGVAWAGPGVPRRGPHPTHARHRETDSIFYLGDKNIMRTLSSIVRKTLTRAKGGVGRGVSQRKVKISSGRGRRGRARGCAAAGARDG